MSKITNFQFRKHVAEDRNGARILGFASLTIQVTETMAFTFSDLKVRVNARGEHTLCAPSRRYKNAQGAWRTSSAYRFDDATYAALRDAIYASPQVVAALGERAAA